MTISLVRVPPCSYQTFLTGELMKLTLIDRDIHYKRDALKRCEYRIKCLKQSNKPEDKQIMHELSQEAFLLQDQLSYYKIIFDLLKEEHNFNDEMSKKI